MDFQKDVRPILAKHCLECHGPDEASRAARLRLDTAAGATAEFGSRVAISPGDARGSELIRRVTSNERDVRMPPAGAGDALSGEDIETLREWINAGAEYEQHWAFQPVSCPDVPIAGPDSWGLNPIDGFVLVNLEQAGLSPASEADRRTLIRRLSLDLIGLPPTLGEVEAFLRDDSPGAYERLVDRLLASPHYGERWARRWLDLARYSDTKGYEKDQPRTMWLYRDWVIDAINNDMPFSQFTIEQVAGDMLPSPSADQLIATGYHRNTMTNEEGGIDPQEYRYLSVVDRVATTGATWLGLTVGCAQCHTHKYDPITHEEYFGLFAMLNNADELEVDVPTAESRAARAKVLAEVDRHKKRLARSFQADGSSGEQTAEEAFETWLAEARRDAVPWEPMSPVSVQSNLPTVRVLNDGSVLAGGDVTKSDAYTCEFDCGPGDVGAVRIEVLPHESLPHGGPGRQTITDQPGGRQGGFLLTEVDLNLVRRDEPPVSLKWGGASASYSPENASAGHAIDGRHDTGWSAKGREGTRQTLELTFAEPVRVNAGDRLRVELRHDSFYPAAIGRFRVSKSSVAPRGPASGHRDEVVAILLSDPSSWGPQQRRQLWRRFLETTPQLEAERERILKLEASAPRHPTALVFQERSIDPRVTLLRHRGEYLQPREPVLPGVPSVLPGLAPDQPANRSGLAAWLVDNRNPLTPRVFVNRQWHAFFGRGIVKTLEDFGYQGDYPSHPELLDWLASEFVRGGWSRKRLHRLIVTSATYRQSSSNPAAAAADPENVLVGRFPRVRLEAELLRDSMLTASGLLERRLGGPSVFPPQPAGITERSYGPLNWVVSEGEDRYRRGIYTFNKRTAPYAAFGLFDAPSGEFCVVRRGESNTPLQALTLLNDQVVSECARALAIQMMDVAATDVEIASGMFERCTTRLPTRQELDDVLSFVSVQRDRLGNRDLDPLEVLDAGQVLEWNFESSSHGWTASDDAVISTQGGSLAVESKGGDPHIRVNLEAAEGRYTVEVKCGDHRAPHGPLELFWTTLDAPVESPAMRTVVSRSPSSQGTLRGAFVSDGPLRSIRLDTAPGDVVTRLESVMLRSGDERIDSQLIDDPVGLAAWQMAARALLNLDEVITKP